MRNTGKRYTGYIAGFVLLGTLLVFTVPLAWNRIDEWQGRSACNANLGKPIDCALEQYAYPNYTNYPATLVDLPERDMSPICLVCPEVTKTYGCPWPSNAVPSVRDMDKWTDYIYVAGLSLSNVPPVPIVICPPINHRGKGGNVLFTDWHAKWIPSPEIDRLIDWTYAYAGSNGLRIVVSEAVTKRSGGRYKSYP